MNIGYLSTIYHTSFILKHNPSNYLNNYPLNWSLYATGPAMMHAFKSGEIDMGYVGLPPVMIAIENGLDIKCVGGGHVEGTVMVASNSYKSYNESGSLESVLDQFEAKKIGVPSPGSIHDVIVRDLMEGRDITVENYPWADFIVDALEEGEIDAGIGTPSLATAASRRFNSQIIIPPDQLWPYNPSYGIVVKEELINDHQDFIMNFLQAHEEACNLIRKQPEIAGKIALREIEVIDKDFVLDTYKISPRYCASLPEHYINSTLNFIPVLQNLHYLQDSLKMKDIFETEFIKKIHPEPAHYDLTIVKPLY